MNPTDVEALAVLDAADHWVAAIEALVAAKQASEETEAEREAVDLAETRLALAVKKWRSKRTEPGQSLPG